MTPRFSMASVRDRLSMTLPASADPSVERSAAVAAILRERADMLEVLFIRRAEREGDPWSGHMAFPGGRRGPLDTDLLATAIRETSEEIGVDLLETAKLVGVLEDQEATGRGSLQALPTRPFVFELVADATLAFNHEVAEALWTPVEPLYLGTRRTTVNMNYRGQDYALPGWDLEGRVVWGLTYRMMSTFFGVVTRL